MKLIFLIFCTNFCGAVDNYKVSKAENQNSCENDVCLSKNRSERTAEQKISKSDELQEFTFENLTNNLSERDVYFLPDSDLSFGSTAVKTKNAIVLEEDTTTKVTYTSTENVDKSSHFSTAEDVEQKGVTGKTELNEFSNNEFSSSTTAIPKTTESILKSTQKSKTTAVQTTNSATQSVLLKNNNKSICFCDILVNECDINCCCDEDCSPSHFKVFTKCVNKILYDSKYCYKNNFIFENNTYHKIIQSSGGLFCIVKENVEIGLKFETKQVLTSLEAFNKSLPTRLYLFSYKTNDKFQFINTNYVKGSTIWTVQNGELLPFKILHSSVGLLCNAEVNIKFLVDQVELCFYKQQPQSQCQSSKVKEVLYHLKDLKIISSPTKLDLLNSSMLCRTNVCIGITSYLCLSIDNGPYCIKVTENSKSLESYCWNALSHIQYKIWHNGTEGIVKMEAYLWVRKLSRLSSEFLLHLTTEVDYVWVGSTTKIFKRSGNPGYLTGKPILAGRKVYNTVNETFGKKEAIELSSNPKDWLSILGSEKGICSSTDRVPINFRENMKYMCSLKLTRYNFSKENCVELQNNIFKLLVGNEIINETKENYFNKFVGTFGNSRVEETGDWVQVLMDLVPVSSSQAYFKANHYQVICKNIITDLNVNIVYSNIGSFLAPQAKILGVSFQFGKHRDLVFHCGAPDCGNTALVRYFKLSSAVHFIDVTKPAKDAFAEPLSLDIKFPHDFFYPFFSKSCKSQFLNKYALILFLSTFFK